MEKKSLLDSKEWTSNHFLSVEPALFIFMVGITMSDTIFQNFLLFKTCTKPNYTESKCDTELDSEVTVSQLLMFRTVGLIPLCILMTSCAGSLIDRNLKWLRWFLLQPAAFQLIADATSFVNSVYLDCSPIVLTIYSTLLCGLSGSSVAAQLISITYVSHVSTEENRSVKIGRTIFATLLGQSLGSVLAGYVVEIFGFSRGFLICVGLCCFSLISNIIFTDDLSKRHSTLVGDTTPSMGGTIGSAIGGLKILFRKRKHNKRRIFSLLILANFLNRCIQLGIEATNYLFLRNKFGWEAAQNGVYLFYMFCMEGLGILITTEIFKRHYHFRDTTTAVIASCSMVVYLTWWFMTFQSWQVYLAPILGIFRSVIDLVSFSLATKCVEPEEYGRISSVCALCQILLPLSVLAVNTVYQCTLRVYPTAIFLYLIPFGVAILIIFRLVQIYMKELPY